MDVIASAATARALGSTTSRAGERYDVFFSYNRKDAELVSRIYDYVRKRNVRAWVDWKSMPRGGHSQSADLFNGLQSSDSAAVFLGPHLLGDYGRAELEWAETQSRNLKKRMFLVLLPGFERERVPEFDRFLNVSILDLAPYLDKTGRLSSVGLDELLAHILNTTPEALESAGGSVQRAASSLPATVRPEPSPRHRALLIGNAHYSKPGLAELTGPVTDVAQMRQALEALQPPDDTWQVRPLVNASRDQVYEGIKWLFADAPSDGVCVFYYSGHGIVDPDLPDTYLAVADTDVEEPGATAFRLAELAAKARKVPDAVVILDCCYAANGDAGADPFADPRTNVAALYASRLAVQDASQSGGLSPFTAGLIEVLRGVAGEELTTGALRAHLAARPEVTFNPHFRGDIVLSRAVSDLAVAAPDAVQSLLLEIGGSGTALCYGEQVLTADVALPDDRVALLTCLVSLLEATLASADSAHMPVRAVEKALMTVGAELATMAVPPDRLTSLAEDQAQAPWDVRFASDACSLSPLPWELMAQALHERLRGFPGQFRMSRVVWAAGAKAARQPVRSIALFNSFTAESAPESAGPLAADAERSLVDAGLVAELDATAGWFGLQRLKQGTFDVAAFFAPLRLKDGAPEIWLVDDQVEQGWTLATEFAKLLPSGLTCVVLETVANQAANDAAAATRAMATLLAERTGVNVVAICHPAAFLDLHRQLRLTFTGCFVARLARHSVLDAALAGHAEMTEDLKDVQKLQVGVPMVVRVQPFQGPEQSAPRGAPATRRPA